MHNWVVRSQTNQNETSLTHYGVKGMKWGVRKEYQKVGRRKSSAQLEGKMKYNSPTREFAKNFAIGVGKQLIAYTIPGSGIVMDAKAINDWSKQLDSKDYGKGTEKLKDLRKKPEGVSNDIMADMKAVNHTNKKGYVKNCFNCVCALEMRQRGYDVESLPRSFGAFDTDYQKMFNGVKLQNSSISRQPKESRKDWVTKNYDYLCKNLEANPEGSRGFISFAYEGTKNGHTISWKIENGQANFYDAQSGKKEEGRLLSLSDQNYTWGRLDNAKPSEMITEVVGSKKGKN